VSPTVRAKCCRSECLDELPMVIDATETEQRFGVTATAIDEVIAETLAANPLTAP
jgi:hypothetical protein